MKHEGIEQANLRKLKNSRGLQEQRQHHHRGNIANHYTVEPFAAEFVPAALHFIDHMSGLAIHPTRIVDSRAMKGIITLLLI